MFTETEAAPSSTLESLSQTELLERRAQLEEEYGELDAQLRDDENLMSTVARILETAPTDMEDLPDEIDYLVANGEAALSGMAVVQLNMLKTNYNELAAVTEQLDARFAKELVDYVRDKAAKIVDQVDIDLVEELSRKGVQLPDSDGVELTDFWEELPSASDVLWGIKHIADVDDDVDTYEKAELLYDTMQRHRSLLERWGVLKQVPKEAPHEVSLEGVRGAFVDAKNAHERKEALRLNGTYRAYHYELYPDDAARKPMLPMHEWAVDLSDDERAALDRHLQSLDVKKEVDRLSIEGLELLPFPVTEEALRAHLERIPAIAFEGVQRVAFKQKTADEHERDSKLADWDGRKVVETAHHYHDIDENSAEIVVWVDRIIRDYEYLNAKFEEHTARYIVQREMLETIDHEFGHALHTKLPVHLLAEWDRDVQGSTTDVSEYVRQERLSGKIQSFSRERFADTFKLFLNNAEALDKGHYNAMQKVYSRTTKPAEAHAIDPDDWWGVVTKRFG